MTRPGTCLYRGEVGHQRLRPMRHAFRYRVYNLFVDLDELDRLGRRLKLFSYNRFNMFSVSDRDHATGDGTPIRERIWSLVRANAAGADVEKIYMFCYPRVLGYVFNPLTVYYAFDASCELRLMIYEVNNTYDQRHTYVIPSNVSKEHSCEKKFYVSPFNSVEGQYDFTFGVPGEHLKLAILLSTQDGPRLNAWFSGKRVPLTDRALLWSFLRLPLLPLKVIAAIHWEAARLWWKGLRPVTRPAPLVPNVSQLPASPARE